MTTPLDELSVPESAPLIPDFDLVLDPFRSRVSHITWKESVPASLTRSVMVNVISRFITDKTDVVKGGVINYLHLLAQENKLKCFGNTGKKIPRFFWRYDFTHELKPGDQVLTLDGAYAFSLDDAEKYLSNPISNSFYQRSKSIQRGYALGVFLGTRNDVYNKSYAVVFVLNRPMVYSVWDLSVIDGPKGWLDSSNIR